MSQSGIVNVKATVNVRLPEHLKARGDEVLAREGVSVSQLVRELYQFLVEKQELPVLLDSQGAERQAEHITEKRTLLHSLVGIIPSDCDVETLRDERLQRQMRPGVH